MTALRIAASCFVVAVVGANGGSPVQQAPAKMADVRNPLEGNEQARL